MEPAKTLLRLKTCGGCAQRMLPPVFHCPACGSSDLQDREVDALGEIYTLTTVHATFGSWGKKTPFTLSVVALDEGLRVIAVVEDQEDPSRPFAIGDRVRFSHYEDGRAPIFARAQLSGEG